MPMENATKTIFTEELKETREILKRNPEAKRLSDEFEAECKLRKELAVARKQLNLTQMELKERTGLTQQVISRIEKDYEVSPSLKNLIKYVNAIGYELTIKPKEKEIEKDTV